MRNGSFIASGSRNLNDSCRMERVRKRERPSYGYLELLVGQLTPEMYQSNPLLVAGEGENSNNKRSTFVTGRMSRSTRKEKKVFASSVSLRAIFLLEIRINEIKISLH